MSLATLRAHVWKGGTDVVLHYRANGRKPLRLRTAVTSDEATQEGVVSAQGDAAGDEGGTA